MGWWVSQGMERWREGIGDGAEREREDKIKAVLLFLSITITNVVLSIF